MVTPKLIIATLTFCLFSFAFCQNVWLENQLHTLVQEHFEALEAEDLQAIENTLHPDSLFLGQSLEIARQVSTTYDLTYSPGKHWIFLAQDKDYAYARIEYLTRKLSGPSFADNAVDQLWAFRQHEGEWRIWSSTILNIDYLVPPISERGQQSSNYLIDAIFIEADVRVVDCVNHDEFSEFAEQKSAVCGLTSSDWETFREDTRYMLEYLSASEWQSGSEGAISTSYFDKLENQNFKLTFTPGGFLIFEPANE